MIVAIVAIAAIAALVVSIKSLRSFTIATIVEIDSDSITAIVIVATVGGRYDRWCLLANLKFGFHIMIATIVNDCQRSYGNLALWFHHPCKINM